MDDTALLTDDEIVALCAADGRPWPIGLTTVETSVEELTRAGQRGMRSLLVRRLAHHDAEVDGMRPHEMIANDVAAFLDATRRVGVYIAPAAYTDVIAGASITAAETPAGWVVDTATAAGVHALQHVSDGDSAAAAVLTMVEEAYAGTLFTDEAQRSAWACVVRFGPDQRNVVTVGAGSASGTIAGAALDGWTPADLRSEFARSA